MNGKMMAGLCAALVSMAGSAQTRHAATVTLDGAWYLQSGTVLNQSDDGISVTGLTYSMGAQIDGAGVWETYLGGGQHERGLPGSGTHYTTQVWSALAVASQASWSFSGLDLDRIIQASTGRVDSQNLDFGGESLRHAYVQVTFSDGHEGRAMLAAQGWDVTQVLYIGDAVASVPEPDARFMLMAGAAAVWGCRRRCRVQPTLSGSVCGG